MLYGNWKRALDDGLTGRGAMVDATPLEKAAMEHCLRIFGDAAEAIGFDKPLGAYTKAEALGVIEAIVTAYVEEMATQHEASKYPPVAMRDPGEAVHDPIRASVPQPGANALADLKDDLPWEVSP